MKKFSFLALLILAVPGLLMAGPGKKKEKKPTETAKAVSLVTPSDSVSYAAGIAATQGLKEYLQRQMRIDTTYLDLFVQGYREAMSHAIDPAYAAYIAGTSVYNMANNQILSNMKQTMSNTPDSITSLLFNEGFIAGVTGDTTLFKHDVARNYFEAAGRKVTAEKEAAWKNENTEWLKTNAGKPGVVTLPSGLQYKILTKGSGAVPKSTQTVDVIYEGRTIDGNVFDATSRHGGAKHDSFRCDQVIKGWTEALTSMPVGSKWEIYIPQELAYGARPAGQIKPYSTLIFTVELVGIQAEKQTDENASAAKTAEKSTVKTAKPAARSTGRKK